MLEAKILWRVVYRRSIMERKTIGYREKEAFGFFEDKNIFHGYTAILEYKLLPGAPWTTFAHIFINKSKVEYTLIAEDGRILNYNPVKKKDIVSALKKNPSPKEFCDYLEKY